MSGANNRADLTAIIGATGSGKSHYVKAVLDAEKPPRLLVWDWKAEYSAGVVVDCPKALAELLRQAGKGPAAVIYRARKDQSPWVDRQFDLFCRLALSWGRCRVIVEELSTVTRASWAPASWQMLCTEGRHEALRIIGTTQRPALVDKTILSNATLIRCGRLNFGGDKKAMADTLDLPVDRIRALVSRQWLVKDCDTGSVWEEAAGSAPKLPRRGRVKRADAT